MNRREFSRALGLGALAAGVAGSSALAAKKRRPNVILIMTDDQGYGDLGCHGNPKVKTPNLDRLHGESVRLTNFHVDPTCSPTRAALLTGRYSHRTGVWHTIMGRNFLRSDETTMADVFRRSGYRTGIFGKWHLGGHYPFRPIDRGFDEWVGHGDGGTGTVTDYWGNDKMNDTYLRNGEWEKFEGFCTDIYFDEAIKFMERPDERPFFAYLPTNIPHKPWNLPEEWVRSFLDEGLSEDLAYFYATIQRADYNIGRLREFLKERGLADGTILIFLTDNGSSCQASFNAGMRGKKGSQYEGGHRVPCFLHWSGCLEGGRDVAELSAHLDILPTLIELCELEPPSGVEFDGRSLLPLLEKRDEAEWPDRALLVESQRIKFPQKWRQSAMMSGPWRLIDGRELYDLRTDPAQKRDVASSHPEVVTQLRVAYENLWPGISSRDEEFARPVIGSSQQLETVLTCEDWFPTKGNVPWNQTHILEGPEANGFWPLEVARPGVYRFRLRRWPQEVNRPIAAGLEMAVPGDVSVYGGAPVYEPVTKGPRLPIRKARLRIAGRELERSVPEDAAEVVFVVPLERGLAELQTWFEDETGGVRGAYYVSIDRRSS